MMLYGLRWFSIFLVILLALFPVHAEEIRGAVAGTINGESNLFDNSYTWTPYNFGGFYYDLKKDFGTENLVFVLTEGNRLSGDAPYGVTYTTTAQSKDFERALWGSYKIISFMGEPYFAGYNQGYNEPGGSNIFYAESTDKNSLSDEQLEKILMDSRDEAIVTPSTPLKLAEGYELVIKYIDNNGMFLELKKNGDVVDSKVLAPSRDGATELEKTYYYRNPNVGDQTNLITIGVHFQNAHNIQNQTVATIDGIWQISDIPTEVRADTQYDKMTIRLIDAIAGVIAMDNKDNAIILSKNKDITLMPGIRIRTANNDTLRFYIYSEGTRECG